MSKRYTVYANGQVAQPFSPVKAEDNKGIAVWFYAGRGEFDFIFQGSDENGWCNPIQFSVPTATIRKALRLVDSVKAKR